ncbi:type 4a pilus biogenesis protein PilO [Patescibacteria group bacterium]
MTNGQDNPQAPVPQETAPKEQAATPQAPKAPKKAPEKKIPLEAMAPTEKKGKKDVNMDMMMLKETIVNYIVPIVCLIASVLIGVFILMPSYKSIPNLSADLDQKTMLEINLRAKLNNMNRLLDFKGIVEENSDLVNKVLVSEELVPGLLTQIDKIARESGLDVNRLNYGLGSSSTTGATKATYNTVTINLGVEGNFGQLKAFMENVENAARVVLVDNFRYSLSSIEGTEEVSVNFVLVSPYLFVESSAVTDDPVDLDIADEEFQTLINKIKGMKYYDPYEIDTSIPLIETPEEEELEGEEVPATTTEETIEEIVEETVEETESIFP